MGNIMTPCKGDYMDQTFWLTVISTAALYAPLMVLLAWQLNKYHNRDGLALLRCSATLSPDKSRRVHRDLALLLFATVLRTAWLLARAFDLPGRLDGCNTGSGCVVGVGCTWHILVSLLNRVSQLAFFFWACRVGPSIGGAWRTPLPNTEDGGFTRDAPVEVEAQWHTPKYGWDMSLFVKDPFLILLQVVLLLIQWFSPVPFSSGAPMNDAYYIQVVLLYALLGVWYAGYGLLSVKEALKWDFSAASCKRGRCCVRGGRRGGRVPLSAMAVGPSGAPVGPVQQLAKLESVEERREPAGTPRRRSGMRPSIAEGAAAASFAMSPDGGGDDRFSVASSTRSGRPRGSGPQKRSVRRSIPAGTLAPTVEDLNGAAGETEPAGGLPGSVQHTPQAFATLTEADDEDDDRAPLTAASAAATAASIGAKGHGGGHVHRGWLPPVAYVAVSCAIIAALFLLRSGLFLYTPATGVSTVPGAFGAASYPMLFYTLPEVLPPILLLHLTFPGGLTHIGTWYQALDREL